MYSDCGMKCEGAQVLYVFTFWTIKSRSETMTHSGPTISHQLHNQANYHWRIRRAIKVFERLNIALRLRGRYTLLLGLGRYRKSIYVNPLGETAVHKGRGMQGGAVAWVRCELGIMPTLDG